MGQIKRGNYKIQWQKADHKPRHVHVYSSGRLVLKYDLENGKPMNKNYDKKALKIVGDLIKEKLI